MFAPVATRFRTYGIEVDPVSRDYIQTMIGLPAMSQWYRDAAKEVA
jgi:glutathione S-transferase